ncbi:hypothetical protein BDR03DRAFT_1017627 [Suillus americanus]|nr:hypothetical protein BDR03DRAFT_1017627 [Suillus americanus]
MPLSLSSTDALRKGAWAHTSIDAHCIPGFLQVEGGPLPCSFDDPREAGGHDFIDSTRLAVEFPPSHLNDPCTMGSEYFMEGMSLEDVILMQHRSDGCEECNRDLDVEDLLHRSTHGLLTTDPASSARGYSKTCHQSAAIASSKKQRVLPMQKGHRSGLPLPHDSIPCKPPFLITPSSNTIAAPVKLPPSSEEYSTSVLVCPTTRGASTRQKSEGKVRRDTRWRKVQIWDPFRKAEEMKSNGGIDAIYFKVSATGWQGTKYASSEQGSVLRKEWVPYQRLKTHVRDCHGQLWLVRTFIGPRIEKLLPLFEGDAAAFVSTVEQTKGGFSEGMMEGNARGHH